MNFLMLTDSVSIDLCDFMTDYDSLAEFQLPCKLLRGSDLN